MGGAIAKPGGPTPANLAWGGVGLVGGALSTLLGDLGVKELLSNAPFVGLAIFCLLAAVIIIFAGLVAKRTGRNFTAVMMVFGLLVAVGLTFGGFAAFSAPQQVQIIVSPQAENVPAIEIIGAKTLPLKWETRVPYKLSDGTLTLSASRFQGYYRSQLESVRAHCVAVISESAGQDLGVGSTQTGY